MEGVGVGGGSVQVILNIMFALCMAAGGWIIRSITQNLEDLRRVDEKHADEINKVRVELPSHYAAKTDMREFTEALFRKLDRIELKLDGKEDKD